METNEELVSKHRLKLHEGESEEDYTARVYQDLATMDPQILTEIAKTLTAQCLTAKDKKVFSNMMYYSNATVVQEYFGNQPKLLETFLESHKDFPSALLVLSNITHSMNNIEKLMKAGVLEEFKRLLETSPDEIHKLIATCGIAYLVGSSENKGHESLIAQHNLIPYLLELFDKLKTSDSRLKTTIEEISEVLIRLSYNEKNKKNLIDAGILPILIKYLKKELKEGQMEKLTELLSQLCFLQENQKLIQENTELYALLLNLEKKYTNKGSISKNLAYIMWLLKEKEQVSKQLGQPEEKKTKQKQIMISYNWGSQPMVVQLVQNLKSRGYKVWIDLEQMSGSTLEAMAQAIEESDLILMGVTEKYRLSANCRIEGEYSFSLKKPIIPLMMQDNYKPTGWLGALLGSKLWFKFSCENDLQSNFDQLLHELDRNLGTPASSPLPVTSTPGSTPSPTSVHIPPTPEKKKENLCYNWDQKKDSSMVRGKRITLFKRKI